MPAFGRAGGTGHAPEQAAAAPVVGDPLPGRGHAVAQARGLGFGHGHAGHAALRVDEGAEPQGVLPAGDRGDARGETVRRRRCLWRADAQG